MNKVLGKDEEEMEEQKLKMHRLSRQSIPCVANKTSVSSSADECGDLIMILLKLIGLSRLRRVLVEILLRFCQSLGAPIADI